MILEEYCRLAIPRILGMPGHAHPKRYYYIAEFCVHLRAKKQLHCPCFTGDIANICKLFLLDTLEKSVYANPK